MCVECGYVCLFMYTCLIQKRKLACSSIPYISCKPEINSKDLIKSKLIIYGYNTL